MGWFVVFSGSQPHPSPVIIPPQTGTKFIHEQYPMLFDGSGTITMTPHQASSPVLSTCARSCILCSLLRMVWEDPDPAAPRRKLALNVTCRGELVLNSQLPNKLVCAL
ncbi:hypothetical protein TNCV_99471 [Trichonephila clavipes]|nr:hypothetical protein TNCV_99471 [Trichonephila clavipes]